MKELDSGITIIADRYAFSGIAFSAAKYHTNSPSSTSKTLTYEWCKAPDSSLPAPDLVLFLDISPESQASRGGYGEERYEKAELQARVRDVFRRIAGEFSEEEGSTSTTRWVEVDAEASMDEVTNGVWDAVKPFWDGTDKPVGRLWKS